MNKRQKKKAYKKKYGVNPTDEVKAVCEALKHFPEIVEQLNDLIDKTLKAVSDFFGRKQRSIAKMGGGNKRCGQ